ncbi:MAG: thermonuclease family protein [Actinomycetota bacterium]|nr:thermonuclease family protein [Actinomycetota bacterium]
MLIRLWAAFQRWTWGRRLLLVVLAPWLVTLAWMWTTGKPRWRTAIAVVGTASIWLGFVLAPFAEDTEETTATGGTTSTTPSRTLIPPASTTFEEASTTTTLPTPPITASPVDMPPGEDTTVSRVVDGDTIEVTGGERVRLIGIDTPEVYGGAECYGQQASAYMRQQLPVRTAVRLVYDVERLDRFWRSLAYVYRLPDGLFVNAALVREGYASVATYPPNVAHVDEFLALQRQAREAASGCGRRAPRRLRPRRACRRLHHQPWKGHPVVAATVRIPTSASRLHRRTSTAGASPIVGSACFHPTHTASMEITTTWAARAGDPS